jgi:hypothetical protein
MDDAVTPLGSWAHTASQWLALVTAWPIICFVGVTLWISLNTYGFQRLRLDLLKAVRHDLLGFTRFPAALLPRERDVLQRALDEVDRAIGELTRPSVGQDEHRAYEVTSLLFTRSGEELDTAEIEARASEIGRRARVALAERLNRAPPLHVARRWLIWITLEEAKALVAAFRHIGLTTAGLLIRRAGGPVTHWGIGGLFVSLVLWVLVSRSHADFVTFIGFGTAVGAYSGVAVTALSIARDTLDPAWRGASRAAIGMLVFCALLVCAMLILLYEGVLPFGTPEGR